MSFTRNLTKRALDSLFLEPTPVKNTSLTSNVVNRFAITSFAGSFDCQLIGETLTKINISTLDLRSRLKPCKNPRKSTVFYTPHYLQLLKNEFDTIQINVKTDTNKTVPFQYGKIIAQLHFRRVNVFGI